LLLCSKYFAAACKECSRAVCSADCWMNRLFALLAYFLRELCTMWHVTFGCNDSWDHSTHVLHHVKLLKINPNF
jgi:hypothetical protein